jgi:hypothetical protein
MDLSSRLLRTKLEIKIYKIIICPVVLYDSETTYLALKGQYTVHKACLFKGCMMSRIFETQREAVPRGGRKFHNEEFHNCYPSPNVTKRIKFKRSGSEGNAACLRNGKRVRNFGRKSE